MSAEFNKAVDDYVRAQTPALMLPKAGGLEPLAVAGHRYLVGAQGLALEYRRAWCHGVLMLAPSAVVLPFGDVQLSSTMTCGGLPKRLVDQFVEVARAHLPNEVAAWITWDENAKADQDPWALVVLKSTTATGSYVQFERPVLAPGVHLVIDIHSHGGHAAFFSKTDDKDDADASCIKFAMVVGSLYQPTPTVRMRMCALGAFQPIGGFDEIQA